MTTKGDVIDRSAARARYGKPITSPMVKLSTYWIRGCLMLRLQNASPGLKALWKLEAEKKLVEA
jgi:hypothetical protein